MFQNGIKHNGYRWRWNLNPSGAESDAEKKRGEGQITRSLLQSYTH